MRLKEGGEAGSGTILAAGLACVLLFAMTALSSLVGASQSRWAAQTAADLAALAAAQDLIDGATISQACGHGQAVARANQTELTNCRGAGQGRVTVEAAVTVRSWPGGVGRAKAVAGPPPGFVGSGGAGNSSDLAALAALDWARQQIGKPYIWGGTGPNGFDCSGLVQMAYLKAVGKQIPRVAQDQYNAATKVPPGQMRPGDLIFWIDSTGVHHVALYAGNGMMVEAPSRGKLVREVPIRWAGTTELAGRY
ncbi:MAG: NlpC/P60 family protein [Micrococcales bacterium]|nr:NlpC/P60 family protein [Micrococcales bacterium]